MSRFVPLKLKEGVVFLAFKEKKACVDRGTEDGKQAEDVIFFGEVRNIRDWEASEAVEKRGGLYRNYIDRTFSSEDPKYSVYTARAMTGNHPWCVIYRTEAEEEQ